MQTDYLVIGAGAMGMAFVDALTAHSDAQVLLIDRRDAPGGHWREAYPFVRLHQASVFYGVASTPLGDGGVQEDGPEQGLHERATVTEICAYYDRILEERFVASGRVVFYGDCDYVGDGRFVSRATGERYEARVRRRVVDARYLAPTIPATTPPPFGVADGARVVPVNELVGVGVEAPEYVIVGSGKTATDACVWLLERGVDPGAIRWVRPREPWMLNRAVIQPDPAIFMGMAADTMAAAAEASSLDDLFLRLEDAGVMLRIDRTVTPTMAKTPTLAQWELDHLRTIENVIRMGHIRGVSPGRIELTGGDVTISRDAVVVHCAASGLQYPTPVPIWGDTITLQPIRAGFPCFGAALAGYVEATRDDDDEKNRLCPPTPYSNTRAEWAKMQVLGQRSTTAFGAEPDIRAWASEVALNPARIPPGEAERPELVAAVERLDRHAESGIARLRALAGDLEGRG